MHVRVVAVDGTGLDEAVDAVLVQGPDGHRLSRTHTTGEVPRVGARLLMLLDGGGSLEAQVVGRPSGELGGVTVRVVGEEPTRPERDGGRTAMPDVPVRVRVDGEERPGVLVDLSGTGAQVRVTDVLPVGAAVVLVGDPGGEERTVDAEVARVADRGDASIIGVRFTASSRVEVVRFRGWARLAASGSAGA